MKTLTEEQQAEFDKLPLDQRVALKSSLWEVGDTVQFCKDGIELEGKITKIDAGRAFVETRFGEFTEKLAFCYKD